MTKEEYFTGSNITNYCVTTAYLQDAPMLVLRDLADRIQEEVRKREESIVTEEEEKPTIAAKKTVSASDKGTELICLGRLETQENYLLDILKENGLNMVYLLCG